MKVRKRASNGKVERKTYSGWLMCHEITQYVRRPPDPSLSSSTGMSQGRGEFVGSVDSEDNKMGG